MANILLVIVTAAYAALTFWLARSSSKSAASAVAAADAAAASVRMQQAALEARLSQHHAWFKTGGGGRTPERWEIDVRPLLGSYWVHEVRLLDVHFVSDVDGEHGKAIDFDRDLAPIVGSLPANVDETTGLRFEVDLAEKANEAFGHNDWRILSWRCLVFFSMAESALGCRRLVVYSDPNADPRAYWLNRARENGLAI